MKYKVGDEVTIKAEIVTVDEIVYGLPYQIKVKDLFVWVKESEMQPIQKQFPREMWVWENDPHNATKAEVTFINPDKTDDRKVQVRFKNSDGEYYYEWYNFCREIEPINLSIPEAKKIIAEAKNWPESEINILNS